MRSSRKATEITVSRKGIRQNGVRAQIAAAAARIMAEDGIDDFGLAKKKAARRLGVIEGQSLPRNDEIESELRSYLAIYQADDARTRESELLGIALAVMQLLESFRPYLTGPVLKGLAGPYAEIELQLFPDSAKEVEIFLLDRSIEFDTQETRRFSGDRVRAVSQIRLERDGVPVRLSIFDSRDERTSLKTSPVGRAIERAGIPEVGQLLERAIAADGEA